jgi:hypothetical protein
MCNLTRTIRRGVLVEFNPATRQAEVRLDGARQGVWLAVGQWVPAGVMTAGSSVAVLLFDETNPDDAVVIGPYGATSPVVDELLGAAKVSQLWRPGGGAVAWQTDAAGNLAGAGDIAPQGRVNGLNARFERLFGADKPANSYRFTGRLFLPNDFANHRAGFEEAQASPYSFGASPGGFSVVVPANTVAASNAVAHWLQLHNNTSAAPCYVQWVDAAGKNNFYPTFVLAPLAVTWDTLVAEWRFWDTTAPTANSRWWAIRFNWLGATMPQFPLRVGLWYSAAVGDGLTFTPTTGTLIQLQAPITPGLAYTGGVNIVSGPACFVTLNVAEGIAGFAISAGGVAGMPSIIRCARLMTFPSWQAQWLDEIRFT